MGLAPLAFAGHAIYTQTNAGAGNQILVFTDGPGSPLQWRESVPTLGIGTDSGLGSQSALVLSTHGQWLLAVNAGSNDISTFHVDRHGHLTLTSRTPSGGTEPISLTQHEDLVYVLNAGGNGNITGFRLGDDGSLDPIPGSTRDLGGNAVGPAQVGFDRSGDTLVVTEKAASRIALYAVDEDGVPSAPHLAVSVGQTPFGFTFDRHDNLLVSEAFGGAPGASAVSSYELEDQGLETESASVPTHQSAACWVVATRRGAFAYATDTGSGTVTGYRVARDGDLRALTADGISGITGPGSAPTDAALGGDELYVLAAN
ncbi:MAG: lactonase family protein, partial [Steroidobacteraceae bacterium]